MKQQIARPSLEGRAITRFSTHKTAALLAYLACHLTRPAPPREILAEMLWPEAEPEAGRTSLRAALASLRRQLEPPGVPSGSILIADRFSVRLNSLTVTTDVLEFEAALQSGGTKNKQSREARLDQLARAIALYVGDLLPGFYESWTEGERERLLHKYLTALRECVALSEQTGDKIRALESAQRLVAADPLDEEAQRILIRALAAAGHAEAALRQFAQVERLWKAEFAMPLEAATRALVETIRRTRHSNPQSASTTASPLIAATPLIGASDSLPSDLQDRTDLLPSQGFASPFPPPRLPLTLTRFFGREAEVAGLRNLLDPDKQEVHTRLITLTGPGGSGKTRFAIETVRQIISSPERFVVFVPLADILNPTLILSEIAAALRPASVSDAGPSDQASLEQVTLALAGQPAALLVLDNFEQLTTQEGRQVVQTLLTHVPALTCLITSRQRLNVEGEREFPLMPLPTPIGADTPERLLAIASVQLFVDRAQAARPDFQLTPGNAPSVAALCQRLEGIPLALELAASWALTLSPAQMLPRLDRCLDLLVSRHQIINPRHRSLRAALESSFQALSLPVQAFFARLSIFRGGWTLPAAEAVCDSPDALVYLTQLRECSLIRAQESGEEMRFDMLEIVREYAGEQLLVEARATLTRRHAAYYVVLAEAAEPELRGNAQSGWLVRLEAEHENMRSILARGNDDPETALRLAGALGRFWYLRGYWSEGRARLRTILNHADASLPTRARALLAAAALAWTQDAYEEARELCAASLIAYRQQEDRWGIASSLSLLGMLALLQGDPRHARTLLEESLTLFRESGDRWGIAHTLDRLAYATRDMGEYAQAETLDRQSLRLRRELGDQYGIAVSISNLADTALLQGHLEHAANLHAESLEHFRALHEPNGTAYALGKMGIVALRQGDVNRAETLQRESLALFWEMQDRRRMASCLEALSSIRHVQNRNHEAACLAGAASALRESIGAPLSADEHAEWERSRTAISDALGSDGFAQAWAQGQSLSLKQAIASV